MQGHSEHDDLAQKFIVQHLKSMATHLDIGNHKDQIIEFLR